MGYICVTSDDANSIPLWFTLTYVTLIVIFFVLCHFQIMKTVVMTHETLPYAEIYGTLDFSHFF